MHTQLQLLPKTSPINLFIFLLKPRYLSPSPHTLRVLRPQITPRIRRSYSASMASLTGSSMAMTCLSFKPSKMPNLGLLKQTAVSFSVSGKSLPSLRLNPGSLRFQVACAAAKPETVEKVCGIVKKQLALNDDAVVTGESKFAALGADSLDTVEIVMGLEEEFGISVEEEGAQSIATVQDAADLIEDLIAKKA